MRVEGAPDFTEIDLPGPTTSEFVLDVADSGLYEFRLTVIAKNGKESAPATGSVMIPETGPLETPPGFSVTLV
jgi:hypothetical protein